MTQFRKGGLARAIASFFALGVMSAAAPAQDLSEYAPMFSFSGDWPARRGDGKRRPVRPAWPKWKDCEDVA